MKDKKVLAIASVGGHWVQLLRLKPAFDQNELIFISTKETFSEMVPGHKYYAISDSNRNNKLGLLKSLLQIGKIVKKEKPDFVVTTGAAPGLLGIIAGKIFGAKTIWIDSIANANKLSLSGKIASRLANRVYTQWPQLTEDKIKYSGNVLS